MYDRAVGQARALGCVDALFRNECGEVTEGAIHSVLIRTGNAWRTPPLTCGVLPGVYRAHLLDTMPNLTEEPFGLPELLAADEIQVCNAVRGMRPVSLAPGGPMLW